MKSNRIMNSKTKNPSSTEAYTPPDEHFSPGTRAYNDNTAEARAQRANAQKFAYACLGIAVLSIFGCIVSASQPRAVPYVIEVNKTTGEVYTIGIPARMDQVQPTVLTPIIQKTLQSFILSLRSVTPDQEFQHSMIEHNVRPFLEDNTPPTTLVSTFYKENNPVQLSTKEIVEVTVDIPQQETEFTYRLHWTEKTETLNGTVTSTQDWTGFAAVEQRAVPIEKAGENPFGIYLTNLTWQLTTTPAASAAP